MFAYNNSAWPLLNLIPHPAIWFSSQSDYLLTPSTTILSSLERGASSGLICKLSGRWHFLFGQTVSLVCLIDKIFPSVSKYTHCPLILPSISTRARVIWPVFPSHVHALFLSPFLFFSLMSRKDSHVQQKDLFIIFLYVSLSFTVSLFDRHFPGQPTQKEV